MKKFLAVLLSVSLIIGLCAFSFNASAFELPKVNDKIAELNNCYSNSASDGFVHTMVYFDVDPVDEEEKNRIAIQRSGVDPADLKYYKDNYRNLTDEEKEYYNEKREAYAVAYSDFVSSLVEQNDAPFLEQMGITLEYSKNYPIYHNRLVSRYETYISICLTKTEVQQAAELDYVEGIVCDRRVSKSNSPYKTILFENNLNWENVYVYGYDERGEKFNGEYPGAIADEKITDEYGDEYYVIQFPIYADEVYVNNGADERSVWLGYYEVIWADYYSYSLDETKGQYGYEFIGNNKCESTYQPGEPGEGNFVLLDNLHWKEAYIYATDSDGNELYGEFPGKQAKRFLNYGGCQFQITVPEGAASIVVSNGKGEKTVPITDLDPYWGYSLAEKNVNGDYLLEEFSGYLPEPGGVEDQWFEADAAQDGQLYINEFEAWSLAEGGEDWNKDGDGEEFGYTYNEEYYHKNAAGETDWVLVNARYDTLEPESLDWVQIGGAGGRVLFSTSWNAPFRCCYGVYDVADNDFMGLDEIPEGTQLFNEVMDVLVELDIGSIYGDINLDGSLDILDATMIQKYASGKASIDTNDRGIGDMNRDYEVDILDATIIQKELVS